MYEVMSFPLAVKEALRAQYDALLLAQQRLGAYADGALAALGVDTVSQHVSVDPTSGTYAIERSAPRAVEEEDFEAPAD